VDKKTHIPAFQYPRKAILLILLVIFSSHFHTKTRSSLWKTPSFQSLYLILAKQLTSCPACRRPCRPCHPCQVRRQILLEFGLLLLQLLRTLRQRKLRFVVLNE